MVTAKGMVTAIEMEKQWLQRKRKGQGHLPTLRLRLKQVDGEISSLFPGERDTLDRLLIIRRELSTQIDEVLNPPTRRRERRVYRNTRRFVL